MDKKLYQTLVEQFVLYDMEELKEVINDSESSEEAIAAAKYIISGDSSEVRNFQSEIKKHEELIKTKHDNMISNPLYEDIHQLSKDIRFIRNIIILEIFLGIVNVILSYILRLS